MCLGDADRLWWSNGSFVFFGTKTLPDSLQFMEIWVVQYYRLAHFRSVSMDRHRIWNTTTRDTQPINCWFCRVGLVYGEIKKLNIEYDHWLI